VHEVPEFYCLDPELWRPDLPIPPDHRLSYPPGTVKIYHAVGNYNLRTDPSTQRNLKCTHIYIPLIDRLKAEGYPVELILAKDIPNKEVRYYQAQADIVVDMLTMGFFGANVREAMMLGKPAICYLRPEWLENMHREIPDYVDELPVISATPETIYSVIIDLIQNPQKRLEIGRKSREFALKWHSAKAGAARMDKIYGELLGRNSK
jgi:glycosyltransferase involved in cell wall biosynthesis